VGEYPFRQLILYEIIFYGFLGAEPRSVVIVLADDLCDLVGITLAEGLHDLGRRIDPFRIILLHLPYN
jgi:hypothetical protein